MAKPSKRLRGTHRGPWLLLTGGAVVALVAAAFAWGPPRSDPARPSARDQDPGRGDAVAADTLFPDIPRIDVHVHVAPSVADAAVEALRRKHVVLALNASGGLPGRGLEMSVAKQRETDGRLRFYCNIDFSGLGAEDFLERTRADFIRCKEAGAVGLKIFKSLGLGILAPEGGLLAVDDPRLDPLFDLAGELALPILIHAGDPQAFFRPPTADNERYAELSAHPFWSFHGVRQDGLPWPSWEAVFQQYERRVRRHPNTTFVGAHFGNAPEEPARVAAMLDANPRYVVETGARIPEIGRHDPEEMRAFFEKYQDRILFGTDFSLTPDGLILGSSGAEPDPPSRVHDFFRAHWRYFETDDRDFAHPTPIQGDWTIDGLGLSREILEKVYWRNAARVFGIAPPGSERR